MVAARWWAAGLAGLGDGVQALDEHQRADDAEENHVGELDQQIDLPDGAQRIEKLHTERGTDQPANQQHAAHLQIDGFALEMRQHAGKGGGDDLVRLGRHRDGGRDADEEQERRHQEPAADAEHARQDADQPAKPKQKKCVHADFCDGKVDQHVRRISLYVHVP